MSNRCPDCNKFVSLETTDPGDNNIEVDQESGVVNITARMTRNCMECGTELKEHEFEADDLIPDASIEHNNQPLDEHIQAHIAAGEEYDLTAEIDSVEPTEELVTKDRKSKPITSMRYMKTLIGVEINYSVTCSCGMVFNGEWDDAEQAAYWDELN